MPGLRLSLLFLSNQLTHPCCPFAACGVLLTLQYKAGNGKLTVGDVLIQIAADRGHKTIVDENRAERLSYAEEVTAAAAAGGVKQHGHHGSGSNSNGSSAKASNVTSFAVDDFSDSEDYISEGSAGSEGSMHSSSSKEQLGGGGGAGSDTSAAAAAAGSSQKKQQEQKVADAAAAAAMEPKLAGEVGQAEGSGGGDGGDDGGSKPRHKKQHKHHHKHRRAVGVMLDVSQHGHVSVALVPGDV